MRQFTRVLIEHRDGAAFFVADEDQAGVLGGHLAMADNGCERDARDGKK
jgi:hypothetical protein